MEVGFCRDEIILYICNPLLNGVTIKKLYKFNSMFFLKYMNGIFSTFSQLQWTPIAPSIRRKICSSMSITKFINQI